MCKFIRVECIIFVIDIRLSKILTHAVYRPLPQPLPPPQCDCEHNNYNRVSGNWRRLSPASSVLPISICASLYLIAALFNEG